MTPYGVWLMSQRWIRKWLSAWKAPIHFLNHYWLIGNLILRNKFRWNSNQITNNLFKEMHTTTSSVKCRPFCSVLSELTNWCRGKMLAFGRRHFQTYFLEWKCSSFTIGWRALKTPTSATPVSAVTWLRSRFNTSGPDPLGFDWEELAASRGTTGGHSGRPPIK